MHVASASSDGQAVSVNGIQLYYEICGEGEPLVLLHNFGNFGQMWQSFLFDFGNHYQLIVPDLRGHGRSTNPTNQFTHRQSALDIFALLDHLEVDHFRAIGVSSGGLTLLHLATQQRWRIESMVLVGATTHFTEQARTIQRGTTSAGEGWDWRELRQKHVYGDEQIRALLSQFHDFGDSYDDMKFTKPSLSAITAETLIVHRDRDLFFPVTIPLEMYTSIPNSYPWIVPNGAHIPIFDDHTEPFAEAALEFLQGKWVSEQ